MLPRKPATWIFATALAAATAAQGKIDWETEFGAAMARAKEEGKPVVACISMEGERVCDVTIEEHYCDPAIVRLSKQTVNLFCSPHGTPAQQELEKRVRIDLMGGDASTWMVAPQHVFFAPDGKVLTAVPYYITPGELEWLWVDALQKSVEGFTYEASERMRPPARLAAEQKIETAAEIAAPPTRKELDEILREIKRGFGGFYGAREKLPVIVRHPSGDARKFVERILESIETSDSERLYVLETIARNSPRQWSSVVTPLLNHEEAPVRAGAVRALAELRDRRALKALHARWRKETDAGVKGEMIRAMVACGPDERAVVKLVPFVIADYDDETVRVQATIAAAELESRKAVAESLTAALADAAPRVRSTAAWATAVRREAALADAVRGALAKEQDAGVRTWLGRALEVLDGGTIEPFAEFLDKVARVR